MSKHILRRIVYCLISLLISHKATAQLNERQIVVLRQIMERPTSVDLHDAPITTVAAWVQQQTGLNCVIDERSLQELGLEVSEKVSLAVTDVPMRTALELMLEPLELIWSARPGVIVLRSVDEEATNLLPRVYGVGGLLQYEDNGEMYADYDSIIDMLVSNVAADTWAENGGGEAEIRPVPAANAIVVTQTLKIHWQIEDLLAQLRDARDSRGVVNNVAPLRERRTSRPKQYVVPKPAGLDPRVYESGE